MLFLCHYLPVEDNASSILSHCQLSLWLWHFHFTISEPMATWPDSLNICVDKNTLPRSPCLTLPRMPAALWSFPGRKACLCHSGALRAEQVALHREQASQSSRTGLCPLGEGMSLLWARNRLHMEVSVHKRRICPFRTQSCVVWSCPNVYPPNRGTKARLDSWLFSFPFQFLICFPWCMAQEHSLHTWDPFSPVSLSPVRVSKLGHCG